MRKLPFLFLLAWLGFEASSHTRLATPDNPQPTELISCDSYPQADFIWPVHFPVHLSGSFGELRSGHFHSGVDIRSSSGKVGDKIYAAAAGYVSRIKIEAGGYGKALYITHPNGYTTVYAHLDRFTDEIETFVKQEQYKRRSFALNIYPPDTLFAFRQNQYIGRMGNRGRSSGPHLHFEIRHTASEEIINPLCFGLKWYDRQPPQMYQLKVYELDPNGRLLHTQIHKLYGRDGHYYPAEKAIKIHSPRVAFAVEVTDRQPTGARNGITELHLLSSGELLWSWHIQRFSFDDTRYVNARQDFAERQHHGKRFYRCHRLPGDLMPNTCEGPTDGYLSLSENQKQSIRIEALDFNGQTAILSFEVLREEGEMVQNNTPFNYILPWKEANLIQQNDIQLYFPENSLYEDLYLRLSESNDESAEYYSKVWHVHTPDVPLHKAMQIGIRPKLDIDAQTAQKAFIAYCRPDGKIVNCGGKWKDGYLIGKNDQLGDYSIQIDSTAPHLQALSFSSNMRGRSRISFRAYDETRTARHIQGLQWKAFVDGQWLLMEYDLKSHILYHKFDGSIPPGKHGLVLIVRDVMGNESKFEGEFYL